MLSLGRRGQVLSLVGLAWVIYGVSVATTPIDTPGWVPHEEVSAPLRGAAWIVTGLVALVTAWWPPGRDRWGFTALVVMPMVRTMSFAVSFLLWALPGWPSGYPRGWVSAVVWAATTQIIMIVAGWPEPPRDREVER